MIAPHPIPRLLLIGDRFSDPQRATILCQAASAGVPWIQLRDHALSDEEFEAAAFEMVDRLWSIAPDVLISINTRVKVASKLSTSAQVLGVHIGTRGPTLEEARAVVRADSPIGMSVHAREQIAGGGIDYYLWSPVFPTRSKPGLPGTGLRALKKAKKAAKKIPVMALGGITPDNLVDCMEMGIHGVAVLSGIMDAENPTLASESYLNTLHRTIQLER